MKRIIFFIIIFLFESNVYFGKTIFSDYKVQYNKVYLIEEIEEKDSDILKIADVEKKIIQLYKTDTYSIYDKNGRKLSVSIIDGVLDGRYEEIYSNGNLYTIGNYKNGEREGNWKIYGENGNLFREYNYKNDKLNGKYYIYFSNKQVFNKLSEEGSYIDNNLEGKLIKYYPNGNKKLEGNYINGKKNGLFIRWYENGNKENVIEYVKNKINGKVYGYYQNGNLLYELEFLGRKSKLKGYDTEGKVIFEGGLENGVKIGKWKYYNNFENIDDRIDYNKKNMIHNIYHEDEKAIIDVEDDEHKDHNH